MNGLIALYGAGEYLPVVEPIDRFLLDSLRLDGRKPRVVCLPTAAGKEGDASIERWSNMGLAHFQKLGAEVSALRIIDRASAEDPQFESALEAADLVYFSGGDPTYLFQTLNGSRAWNAAQKAWARGAIYAGCSAGAMILGRKLPNFRMFGNGTPSGFGVLPAAYVFPHFDAMPVVFKPMLAALRKTLKSGGYALGIDENTALVGRLGGEWQALGQGQVHVLTRSAEKSYRSGEQVPL
ncbi:MAG: Type 1 glutamine amidotransferase-like domain-containing protein [Chloroflexota bacterium]